MKVVLVLPNSKAHTITPPLGLGYLAACVRARGHEAAIIDLARERAGAEKGAALVKAQAPDLIGLGIMSSAYLPAKELVAAIRQELPDTPLVIGGPHVTALAEDAMEDFGVDLAMTGECEQSFPELVEAMAAGGSLDGGSLAGSPQDGSPLNNGRLDGIPGLCFRDGGIVVGERGDFTDDLDSLPFPAWDLMDPRSYPDLPHQLLHKKFPVAPVMTSRGCPYDCSFCASTALWGRGWRTRSAENVVDEIEMLVRDFDVKEIHFEDDNFTLKASHAAAVCEEILRRGIDIVWACPNGVRIDTLDDDLLELMRRSGCYSLGFGIESGSQAVLEKNNKKLKLDRVADQVEMVKRHGIEAFGFFIIGLPGETVETIRETIRFARRVPFDRANFGLLSPLPGSSIFNEHVLAKAGGEGKAGGETKTGAETKAGSEGFDHRVLNYFNPFPIGGLDSRELNRWQRRAVYSFYLRPVPLLKVIRDLRPAQVKQMVKALFDYST